MELEEKRATQSKELKDLQEERATLNNQLLDISDDFLKEASLNNVLRQLKSFVLELWAFHDSFTFL